MAAACRCRWPTPLGLRAGRRRSRPTRRSRRSPTRRWTASPCGPPTRPAPRTTRRCACAIVGTLAAGAAPTVGGRAGRGGPDHDRRADAPGRRRRRHGRADRAWTATTTCWSQLDGGADGNHVRRVGRRRRGRPARSFAGRHRADAGPPRACWPASGVRRVPSCAAAPGRRDLDRRRAGRRRPAPLAPGQIRDSNRPHAAGAGGRAAASRPSTSGSVADDEAAISEALAARRRRVRRRRHQRRRQHGRLRLREGGARPPRRHALDAGGHPAGQAARLRHRRRHARVRPARQPGVVDGVASSCSPARACAR